MEPKKLEVLPVKQEHLAHIARLEAECFHQPWSEKALSLLLGEEACGFVALEDGEVVAYGGMMKALDEGQITNVAVSPMHRRRGYGRAILDALLHHAAEVGAREVFLEVRVSNVGAVALYEGAGFMTVGTRRNFYTGPVEDAYVMRWTLED